jgi:hypothetical protein
MTVLNRVRGLAAILATTATLAAGPALAAPIDIDIPEVHLQTFAPTSLTLTLPGAPTPGPHLINLVGVPSAGTGEEAFVAVTMIASGTTIGSDADVVHTVQNAADNMIDTIIQFNSTGTLVNVGDSVDIGIEITALNLQSSAPILMDLGTGAQLWDVFVGLVAGPQTEGTMTFTRTGENTMDFDISLPEALRVSLVQVANPSVQLDIDYDFLFTGSGSIVLPDFEGSAPAPAGLGLTGLGLVALGMLRRRKRAA